MVAASSVRVLGTADRGYRVLLNAVCGLLREVRHSWQVQSRGVLLGLWADAKPRLRSGGSAPSAVVLMATPSTARAAQLRLCARQTQCAPHCDRNDDCDSCDVFGCENVGAGKCEPGVCSIGYGRTAAGTCALVRLTQLLGLSCLPAQPARCGHRGRGSRTTPCARYAQCAAHCGSCDTAGPGKCDPEGCATGYGPTVTGTCAPVRLTQLGFVLLACAASAA